MNSTPIPEGVTPFYLRYTKHGEPGKVYAINPAKFDNDIWKLVEHVERRMFPEETKS